MRAIVLLLPQAPGKASMPVELAARSAHRPRRKEAEHDGREPRPQVAPAGITVRDELRHVSRRLSGCRHDPPSRDARGGRGCGGNYRNQKGSRRERQVSGARRGACSAPRAAGGWRTPRPPAPLGGSNPVAQSSDETGAQAVRPTRRSGAGSGSGNHSVGGSGRGSPRSGGPVHRGLPGAGSPSR